MKKVSEKMIKILRNCLYRCHVGFGDSPKYSHVGTQTRGNHFRNSNFHLIFQKKLLEKKNLHKSPPTSKLIFYNLSSWSKRQHG